MILVASSGAFTAPRQRIRKTLLRSTPYDAQKEAYLAEPEFDAVSLRQWRRETLVRYNNANQSEPLRVVLFFLLALALLGSNQRPRRRRRAAAGAVPRLFVRRARGRRGLPGPAQQAH